MKGMLCAVLALCLGLSACAASGGKALPKAAPGEDIFGIDRNINMETIDTFLGREEVAYRDVRMLFDPADYGAIGGQADLTRTITGFKVVPYPYIASLSALPVSGGYDGPCLYTLAWDDAGAITAATPNYAEALKIVEELFPQDKAIFLMCGGGGYAGMMKSLLIFLGWDADRLYNIGANWTYTGDHRLELVEYPELASGAPTYATWRADYAYIDFSRLNPV